MSVDWRIPVEDAPLGSVVKEMPDDTEPEHREFTVLIRGKARQFQDGKKATARKIRRQVEQSIIMDPMGVIEFGDMEVIVKR